MPKQQHTSHLLNNAQKRVNVVFALSATALFLSACLPSANTSPSPSTTAISHSNAASKTSSSGHTDDSPLADYIPELGTPDPTDPNFELFEPCSEIPAEAFAAAGLNDLNSTTITGLGTACGQIVDKKTLATLSISTTDNEMANYRNDGRLLSFKQAAPPGSFLFGDPNLTNDTCNAAVETKRGTITFAYQDFSGTKNLKTLCEEASNYLEKVITNGGKKNGDSN